MREMRRKERATSEDKALSILNDGEYGILSTVSVDNKPCGIPLNYCFVNHHIYFHGAVEGEKIDNFEQNKYVSFCVVGKTDVKPDKFSTEYESVIVSGEVKEVLENEKYIAMEGLIKKYSSDFVDQGEKYIKASGARTRVFKIIIEGISGKERKW
jgi:uncharacterized protein